MPDELLKYFPIVKVDVASHMVYGLVTAEVPDADGEIADFDQHREAYKAWSEEALKTTRAAGQEPSLGNIRVMHQLQVGGKAIKLDFDEAAKQILIGTEPINETIFNEIQQGFYRGFSQGGSYAWKKADGKFTRYGSVIGEVSYVDNPCLKQATFQYVRADGSTELRKFVEKAVRYLVPDGKHLPYTGEDGKPDHNLMGAAWAALTSNHRGHAYEGPDKEKALARLREVYRSEGMEPPSGKAAAIAAEFEKLATVGDSQFDTELAKFSTFLASFAGQLDAAIGAKTDMNPEQIKKCAAALGISEEEFKKQFVDGDALEKGKKGLAALHSHLQKAITHHDKMHKAHTEMVKTHSAMADMHKAHAEHLENCMKAHGACMDAEEADKVLKALGAGAGEFVLLGKTADGVEVFKKGEKKAETVEVVDDKKGGYSKAEVDKLIADAIEKAAKERPAGDNADKGKIFSIERDGTKKEVTNTADPMPV